MTIETVTIKDAADAVQPIAADKIGADYYQVVKIAFGADDAVSLVDATGLPVAVVGTVPVSGTVAVSNLASLVNLPVTGTFWPDTQAVSFSWAGLTDTQLRASAVPVSAASLPLPTGAATQTTLATLLTDTQLRASAVPVSLAGVATEATLAAVAAAIDTHDAPAAATPTGVLVMAVRRDADTSPVSADGDVGYLAANETGRLKVAGAPAKFTAVTGAITASTQTVVADVSQASNVMLYVTGTFAGHNCTFEGSIDGGTSWFTIQAVRSNANTIETTTGVIAAAPAYAWEASVNALTNVRVRATAHTSGTANWRITLGSYATEPIPAAQVSGTQPVSGTVTATVTGGTTLPVTPTTTFTNSAATTNATSIKASAGTVWSIVATNTNAAVRYLKLYNKASAPTVGTDVPVLTVAVPALGSVTVNGGSNGIRFATGIALALTTGATDADTGAVAASELKLATSFT